MFLETCSCYREPSKVKVFSGFLVITTSLTLITSCNHFVIHYHVSVLAISDNIMCISLLQVRYMIKTKDYFNLVYIP